MKNIKAHVVLLLSVLFLSACSSLKSSDDMVFEGGDIINVEFFLVKLYAKENLDSGTLIDSLNVDLKDNINVIESLSKYGNAFLENKLILKTIEGKTVDFGAGNTSAYASDLKDNKLIVDYYTTGTLGSLKASKLDSEKYVLDYKIEVSSLSKLESNKKNKITYTPYVDKKEIFQSIIVNKKNLQAVAINNTNPKQYEIIVLGINWHFF